MISRNRCMPGFRRMLGVSILITPMLFTHSANSTPAENASARAEMASKGAALIEKAVESKGKVLVLIGIDYGRGRSSEPKITNNSAHRKSVEDAILASLPENSFREKRRFKYVSAMSAWVDEHALHGLIHNPVITSISEVQAIPPTLTDSTSVINADWVWSSGTTGAGQTIAILDTGVQSNHSFLAGKIISEACYSTAFGTAESGCPDGSAVQIGVGSGTNLPNNVSHFYHGTHVAGIAAGGEVGLMSGVSPGADIISIQVFYIENDVEECAKIPAPAPCAYSNPDDQIAALERVLELSSQHEIAAVNLSLGGGGYSSYCDADSPEYKQIIDKLMNVGVATVISSGNDNLTNKVSFPSCISSAITVGATNNFDSMWIDPDFGSNSANMVDLLAPGLWINSSIPDNDFDTLRGTSMAAPHVAGAFALLKSEFPNLGVEILEFALKYHGRLVIDTRNSIARRRIDAFASIYRPETFGIIDMTLDQRQIGNWSAYKTLMGDIDNDGLDDIIWNATTTSGNYTYVGIMNEDGTYDRQPLQQHPVTGNWSSYKTLIDDVNGDGRSDLIWNATTVTGNSTYIGLSLPEGGFNFLSDQSQGLPGWSAFKTFTADVNGDGFSDLIWNATTTNGNSTFIGLSDENGMIQFLDEQRHTLPGWSSYSTLTGDVNGDGYTDLIWNATTTTGNSTYIGLSDINGTLTYLPDQSHPVSGNWSTYNAFTADINADGLSDMIWNSTTATGNSTYIALRMSNDTFYYLNDQKHNLSGWSSYKTTMADMNGDGLTDIVWNSTTATGNSTIIGIVSFDGTILYTPDKKHPVTGWSSYDTLTGDVNGDGSQDIIWNATTTGGNSTYIGLSTL